MRLVRLEKRAKFKTFVMVGSFLGEVVITLRESGTADSFLESKWELHSSR